MIRRGEALRWGACVVLAVSLHAAGAAALFARWTDDELTAGTPVILLDFAPEVASPVITPPDVTPDVIQSAEAEPEPTPPVPEKETPPPTPEPQLAMLPPPKPVEKPKDDKPKQKQKTVARAAPAAEQKAEQAAAPQQGAAGQAAVQNWISQLYAAIQRHKRSVSDVPVGATAALAILIDRSGGVHNPHIVRSSGSQNFDQEALAMVTRAAPLPPPPPEKPGDRISITVPIRYTGR